MMHGEGKSDTSIVPEKPPNNAGGPAAEAVEGREVANGNSLESNACRTQGRESARSSLERVRDAARREKKLRFTALLHHVYAKRYAEGTNVVVLDPDVAEVFKNRESVNETLRAVARIIDLQSRKVRGAGLTRRSSRPRPRGRTGQPASARRGRSG